jgi:polyisoprenoid-binding protein YceI
MTTTTKLSQLTGDYVLDTAHTRIGFLARAAMVTKVRGQLDEFVGSGHLDGDDPSKSSAQLTIQARSIQTRNHLRDGHLRRHFLDVDTYPTIAFTSTKVEQVDETNFKVTGDLTIHGATKRVTVDFELTGAENDPWGNFRVGLEGKASINRKDWRLSWKGVGPSSARRYRLSSTWPRSGGRNRMGRDNGDHWVGHERGPMDGAEDLHGRVSASGWPCCRHAEQGELEPRVVVDVALCALDESDALDACSAQADRSGEAWGICSCSSSPGTCLETSLLKPTGKHRTRS